MADSHRAAGVDVAHTEHVVLDGSPSEHIYIGSEEPTLSSAAKAQTVREKIELPNPIRRTHLELTLYAEGFLKVIEYRRGTRCDTFRLDLRYLDPVPSITHIIARRLLYTALGCGGVAAIALLLAWLGVLASIALPTGIAAAVVMIAVLMVAANRSHEKIAFNTIHGRATVLCLTANLGSVRRVRSAVPALSRAIEEAAETIGEDTSAYLRSEMREHYRLRGDGVLSNEACAEGTGRILAQFDVQL
jgi:hypothetical protein